MVVGVSIIICLFALALAAVWPFLRPQPLLAGGSDNLSARQSALATTLNSLNNDLKIGLIGEDDAKAAKAEIARKALKLEQDDMNAPQGENKKSIIILGIVAGITPIIVMGAYLWAGQPQYKDMPLQARLAPSQSIQTANSSPETTKAISDAEAFLKSHPNDAQAWFNLAPVYQEAGQYDKAETAYANALEFGEYSPADFSDVLTLRAENLLLRSGGKFDEFSLALIKEALKANPNNLRAEFLTAMQIDQSGDKKAAIKAWQSLITKAEGSPPALYRASQATYGSP